MNQLNEQENEEKHVKSIALRVASHKDGHNDGENLNLLIRKFSKFLKKNSRDKNQLSHRYNNKKVNEFNSTN